MKKLIAVFCVLLVFSGIQVQAQEKKAISLEDIWLYYKFYPSYPAEFNWMQDDSYYTVLEKGKIIQYSIKDQKPVSTILDLSQLKDPDTGEAPEIKSYSFSKDESKLLLKAEIQPIYRRSSKEIAYVYDREGAKLYKLHQGAKVSFALFSPDASKIAFMADNNLFYHNLSTDKEVQITTDGQMNHLIYGGTDWVYEEEFAFTRAFAWSSDSKTLAYYRFDESGVREFEMAMYGQLYPSQYKFKYPKAGEDNSLIELYFYNVDSKKNTQIDLGPEKDQYIPRIKWTKDPQKLAIMRMNRLQNKLEILIADAANGSTEVILTEERPTYVTEVNDRTWIFLEDGKRFLFQSERDGFNHVYLYDLTGKLINQVTSGEWDVTEISAVDEKDETLYFMAAITNPVERQLCKVDFDGKKVKRLTKTSGWHDASFSSSNSYYLGTHSDITTPPKAALYDKKGKEVMVLEDNERLKKTMDGYILSQPEFFKFKVNAADGAYQLEGWMIKPQNFDASKKYPVLMHVYGGPGSQTVKNQFLGFNYFWHQMLANEGYIVVSVDGRGTGGRGEAFKKATYGQLGKLELEDQINAAKYLGGLEYVDKDRIGIWGWSFGGYMSSLCITKGAEFFKLAIAVAPVTSWRFYDTIYTERYLKTPQENPEGYDLNSPIQFADKLDGSYLLVHGTADDNVHFQNSMEWVDALVNANKQFDMAFYPNKNHGIFGGYTRFHLYKKMTDFIKANL